jgi:hypothetical protein
VSDKWNELMEKERQKANAGAGGKVVSLFPPDENALLPGADADYKAAAVVSNGSVARLCCIMGKEEFKPGGCPYVFFQYVHLDSGGEFGFDKDGQVLRLRFSGMVPMTVTVRGRHLLQLCDYIQLHRIGWIRQADRDFTDDEAVDANGQPEPIISRIEIFPVAPVGRRQE